MKTKLRQDKAWLLTSAKTVATKLELHSEGTRLRIRIPSRVTERTTDGWRAVLGDLEKDEPRLEIWLDRLTGNPERKFYAGFRDAGSEKIDASSMRVARQLPPIRTISSDDITTGNRVVFTKRFRRFEFNAPILEKYSEGHAYFGIFDPTRATSEKVDVHFCSRAVAFFEDVVRALPGAAAENEEPEVYPRCEKRKRVASHLRRERSHLPATACKIRDNYQCQVCDLVFEERYGKLGQEFAEAHHRVPLSKLRENVRTKLEDLATVCANCHRTLHHMAGKRDDITKLRAIVRKRRGGRN